MIIRPLRNPHSELGWLTVQWLKDQRGRVLKANRAYAELLGKDLDDVIGKAEDALFPPEVREMLEESREFLVTRRIPQIRNETLPLEFFGDGRPNVEMHGIRDPIFIKGQFKAYSGFAVSLVPLRVTRRKVIRIEDYL